MSEFVFHDPTGRRARQAALAGGLLLSLAAAVVAAFFATLALAPRLPNLQMKDPGPALSAIRTGNVRHLHGKPAWTKIPRRRRDVAGVATKPLTVGFYVPWDERSRVSLTDHVSQLDVLAPVWLSLKGSGGLIDVTEDPQAETVLAKATHKPSVLPVIQNAHNSVIAGPQADALLLNPAARQALVSNLVALAGQRGYAGYIFDFKNLSPKAMAVYPQLIAEANKALDPSGREVWVTSLLSDDSAPVDQLQAAADTLVLMAYDQHWQTGDPGPPAGQDWFEQYLDKRLTTLDEAKTILALGSYGYDWSLKDKTGKPCLAKDQSLSGCVDTVTFHEATLDAHDSDADVHMDPTTLNPTYGYTDEKDVAHQVWFLDAPTVFNEIKVADDYRPRGYGLWRLGQEDPGVWSVLPHLYGAVSAAKLNFLPPAEDVDFDGTGEVLHVSATPTSGKRAFTTDPDTGLISDENYTVMPTAYVVQRYGAHEGMVALTFDDGPDPRWTPQILDILKAKHASATFFVIGKNMQAHPELVAREIREGNLVGSHTFTHPNISQTPKTETDLELNITQRLFQVITGRSLRMFRPPYQGDAEPSTPAEVEPLITAQKLGYLIAGLRIDPDDWKKDPVTGQTPDPKVIVQRVMDRLDHPGEVPGQVILLHDSGGDRQHTVEALPLLIDTLRENGYQLVTVGQLAGLSTTQAMPPVAEGSLELALDRIGFDFFRYVDEALQFLFISAIALGVGRLVFLASLALVHRFTSIHPPMLDPETGPLVSVLIPCFNEEKVIASSVARILESQWKNLEVIVLDDGSSDGTSAAVEAAFKDHPQVQLLRFPNAGKAVALNRGLAIAKGEVLVALDADTLFPPDTIPRLVRWFVDPKIGAVAGNALVGNRLNLITRWQALEYVTAQNLERRALAALGAVTVVPGAVGAWRRTALEMLGGYPAETLAEDQDLTIAVQRAGWQVGFDPSARAYTEAPDTMQGLLKQRFRWSFGTLQCIWKHRAATFDIKRPALGFVALPQIWLFQIALAIASPLVDLAVVFSVSSALMDRMFHPAEWSSEKLTSALFYWAAFILVDISAGALGMALERRAPWKDLLWIPIQRFGYRQLMYYVVVKAVFTAVRGPKVGWGKLERRATAAVEATA
jgi:cellulose synthase/poly-beta-1,6-N-acetylglucosamine synthase-like glycosyltransferase/spore germination protein YaaH/peptidoglycan/xylan/chitin deacetylase (PgdA/CDA1 family)